MKLAEGFEGISIFTADNASAIVLENYIYVVLGILPYAVGYDNVDLKKARALGIKVANVPAYSLIQ
jgi:D-lactate dehydrogenase